MRNHGLCPQYTGTPPPPLSKGTVCQGLQQVWGPGLFLEVDTYYQVRWPQQFLENGTPQLPAEPPPPPM